MAIVALVSGRGAPGVTTSTLALGLSWPLRSQAGARAPVRVLIAEVDAGGSAMGPGLLRASIGPDQGLASVVTADPDQMGTRIKQSAVPLAGELDRPLLLGLSGMHEMAAAHAAWPQVAQELQNLSTATEPVDILMDIGRLGAAAEASSLLDVADVTLVVVRPSLPSITGAMQAVRYLRSFHLYTGRTSPVACLLVGEHKSYPRSKIAASLGVPVVGVLAWDPSTAGVLSEGAAPGRGFRRARLRRTAVEVADRLLDFALQISTTTALPPPSVATDPEVLDG